MSQSEADRPLSPTDVPFSVIISYVIRKTHRKKYGVKNIILFCNNEQTNWFHPCEGTDNVQDGAVQREPAL